MIFVQFQSFLTRCMPRPGRPAAGIENAREMLRFGVWDPAAQGGRKTVQTPIGPQKAARQET